MTALIRGNQVRVGTAGRTSAVSTPRTPRTTAMVAFSRHVAPYAEFFTPGGVEQPAPGQYTADDMQWTGLAFSPDGQFFAAAIGHLTAGAHTNIAWWRREGRRWQPMAPAAADLSSSRRWSDIVAGDTYLDGGVRRTAATPAHFLDFVVVDGFFQFRYEILGTDGINRFYIPYLLGDTTVVFDRDLDLMTQLRWSPDSQHLAALRHQGPGSWIAAFPALAVFRCADNTLELMHMPDIDAEYGRDLAWIGNDRLVVTGEPRVEGVL